MAQTPIPPIENAVATAAPYIPYSGINRPFKTRLAVIPVPKMKGMMPVRPER